MFEVQEIIDCEFCPEEGDCEACGGEGELEVYVNLETGEPVSCPHCGGRGCYLCRQTGLKLAE